MNVNISYLFCRARETLPHNLEFVTLNDETDGKVVARTHICANTMLGPYEAPICTDTSEQSENQHLFLLKVLQTVVGFI